MTTTLPTPPVSPPSISIAMQSPGSRDACPSPIECCGAVLCTAYEERCTNPLLSCWVERAVGIDEGAEVCQARGEVRERIEPQPGEQEASTDEGLQEQPQVVEPMFPAGVLGPGRMLPGSPSSRDYLHCRSGRRVGRRRGEDGRLQAHEQVGTQHQFPPALNTRGIREPKIRPAQLILGVLESIFDPSPQSERVADRLLNLARQDGHELPGAFRGLVHRIGRDLEIAESAAPAKDGLLHIALLAAPIRENPLEGAPGRGADP